jgi:hypothetical protein
VFRRLGIGFMVVASWLLGATSVAGAEPLGFQLQLTTDQPAAPTGFRFQITYPDTPDGKPKPQSLVALTLPVRTTFDESAVPVCNASDGDLMAQGTSACPPETKLGGGTGSVVTGFGPPFDPLSGDATAFHGPGQILQVATPSGSDRVLDVTRYEIRGNSRGASPHAVPGGPPDGQTVGKSAKGMILKRTSASGRSFIQTPSDCPANGAWTSTLTVGHPDGSTDEAMATTPCKSEPLRKHHKPYRKRHKPHRHKHKHHHRR